MTKRFNEMYRLTHVETDIRNKITESLDSSKVHEKKDSIVENERQSQSETGDNSKQKKNNKKYFTVDAVNYNSVDIIAENSEVNIKDMRTGMFIDNLK